MTDVFIAYARSEHEIAAELARKLRESELSVFWDVSSIDGGASFSEQIDQAIRAAKVVVVIWTKTSVDRQWVKAEASYAAGENKLIPVIVGDLNARDLPLPFAHYHTPRFRTTEEAFKEVLVAVNRRLKLDHEPPQYASRDDSQKEKSDRSAREEKEKPWVFVSHVDTDKPRIRPFIERLLERELTVFVDKPPRLGLSKKWVGFPNLKYIRFFDNYRMSISKALDKCGCVLVFWSESSVQTERQIFWDEIEHGSNNGFLVSTMIDDVLSGSSKIPKGFGFSQANIADLCSDEAIDNEFEWVIADINELLSRHERSINFPVDGGD